ncbi:MAG TPA: hypothetical protein VN922_17285 [Bacteroidia bacterium]|nr:hypothetical protein [Bacteroidia bacterium]
MKKTLVTASIVLAFAAGVFATTAIEKQKEAKKHPRIEKAIDAMKDAIEYMDKAPDDFGGHKEAAIKDTKAAIKSLHEALGYRYKQDEK